MFKIHFVNPHFPINTVSFMSSILQDQRKYAIEIARTIYMCTLFTRNFRQMLYIYIRFMGCRITVLSLSGAVRLGSLR